MAASDQEIRAKVKAIAKLREQISDATDKRYAALAQADRNIRAAQLDAEEARLKVELDAAKGSQSAKAANEGAANVIEQIKEGA